MKVFCILSDERVYSSKSPVMFSRVLQRVGIQAAYVPFKVNPKNLGLALQSLKVLNISGANVTVPFKEKVIPHLDVLSEGANIIGAINTIVCNGDSLKGYNTNAIGFMDALNDADFEVAGKSALVFGTGGAAKAVVFMLNWLRAATIRVAGRHRCDQLDDSITTVTWAVWVGTRTSRATWPAGRRSGGSSGSPASRPSSSAPRSSSARGVCPSR